MATIRLEWEIPATLGEGPLWVARENALYWVDIVGRSVHRLGVADGSRKSWQFGFEVTSLAERAGGGLVCTLRDGFAFIDLDSGRIEPIAMPEADRPGNRFNDGKTDAQGRYWAGSMHEAESEASGVLYRLDPDRSLHVMDRDYTISNGPAFSPDGRTLYHNDTAARCIYAFDIDACGSPGNRRVLVRFEDPAQGYPDGLTVDENGDLWQTSFAGQRVSRFSPKGELVDVVEMPVPNITSCTFGGRDLDTLYVTTARYLMNDEQIARYPLAGSLFSFKPGVRGLPTPRFGG